MMTRIRRIEVYGVLDVLRCMAVMDRSLEHYCDDVMKKSSVKCSSVGIQTDVSMMETGSSIDHNKFVSGEPPVSGNKLDKSAKTRNQRPLIHLILLAVNPPDSVSC